MAKSFATQPSYPGTPQPDEPIPMPPPDVEKRTPGGLGVEFDLGPNQHLVRKADYDEHRRRGIHYRVGPAFEHLHELVMAADLDEYNRAMAGQK